MHLFFLVLVMLSLFWSKQVCWDAEIFSAFWCCSLSNYHNCQLQKQTLLPQHINLWKQISFSPSFLRLEVSAFARVSQEAVTSLLLWWVKRIRGTHITDWKIKIIFDVRLGVLIPGFFWVIFSIWYLWVYIVLHTQIMQARIWIIIHCRRPTFHKESSSDGDSIPQVGWLLRA